MKPQFLLTLSCLSLSVLAVQTPINGDGDWPQEIDSGGIHMVIYQPQVDSWKDNLIQARSAVIVTRREDPTEIFGIVSIDARTEVDRETRLVIFEDIAIKETNFPSAASLQPALLKAVRDSVPKLAPNRIAGPAAGGSRDYTSRDQDGGGPAQERSAQDHFEQGTCGLDSDRRRPGVPSGCGRALFTRGQYPCVTAVRRSGGKVLSGWRALVDDGWVDQGSVDGGDGRSSHGSGRRQASTDSERRAGAGRTNGRDNSGGKSSRGFRQHCSRRASDHAG